MKYSALLGKVGALARRFLTREDFKEIISKTSVNDIASYLRQTRGYVDYVPKSDDVHRRELEASLYRRLFKEVVIFKKHLTYPEKRAVEHVFLRCEIDTLKKVLRTIHIGEKLEERFFPCGGIFGDVEKFRTVEDFMPTLSNRPYYDYLSSALNHYKETSLLNQLENNLDFWYFTRLHRILKMVGNRDVLLFLKKQIDLMNILWIYRSRILFDHSSEAALNMIIPAGCHLTRDLLERLASSKTKEEFFQVIRVTPYSDVFEGSEAGREEFLLERFMERYLYKMAKKLLRSGDGFSKLIGYLHILEYEIKDLVTAIETVRYKLKLEEATPYFIRGGI